MKKVAIIYGSSTGVTADIADRIRGEMYEAAPTVIDVANVGSSAVFEEYDVLILGTSTWGSGDLQDDWQNKLSLLSNANLSGKTVAFFGIGDSSTFSDTFVDGMGTLYDTVKGKGVALVGSVATAGYSYDNSLAEVAGELVGVAIDEANEPDQTETRIKSWISSYKNRIA